MTAHPAGDLARPRGSAAQHIQQKPSANPPVLVRFRQIAVGTLPPRRNTNWSSIAVRMIFGVGEDGKQCLEPHVCFDSRSAAEKYPSIPHRATFGGQDRNASSQFHIENTCEIGNELRVVQLSRPWLVFTRATLTGGPPHLRGTRRTIFLADWQAGQRIGHVLSGGNSKGVLAYWFAPKMGCLKATTQGDEGAFEGNVKRPPAPFPAGWKITPAFEFPSGVWSCWSSVSSGFARVAATPWPVVRTTTTNRCGNCH